MELPIDLSVEAQYKLYMNSGIVSPAYIELELPTIFSYNRSFSTNSRYIPYKNPEDNPCKNEKSLVYMCYLNYICKDTKTKKILTTLGSASTIINKYDYTINVHKEYADDTHQESAFTLRVYSCLEGKNYIDVISNIIAGYWNGYRGL